MLAICLAMLETEQDQRRFTRLFEAHEKKIYGVALHILGNQTQAEDAAQQTWLKLVQNWDRISALPWKETEGYAVTAAKNCALDMLRLEGRTTALPEDWDPPAREDGQEEYRYLISLIRSLPENYRRVLELKLVEERSNRDIARRLHISESAVSTRVLRGRAMLKERLEKEGYIYDAV
ncbi:sigma-70 family RNA polymerase sigma factor [uncultured Oscillibacter sp.]|uniref:RNA polymerase sigma factor n=1 Tax=uncultured Oscillibacter sp. TaxID=876091 RepID=UPI0026054801|nr:sigma-70 family RNA polymerase sigma factor [uncultured Oscillibacter sp.]